MQASSAHQQSHSRRASARLGRARRRFGADYEQFVRLRNGRTACIGVLRPGHAAALEAGFERLSAESRYFRFLIPKSKLSSDELRYLTRVDGEHHYGLVARVWTGDGWDGAAVARIVQTPWQPSRVELAVTVLDEYQGTGLGTLLVDRILDAAAERGYRSLVADVLAENRAMVRLLRRLAPEVRSVGTDPRVLELVVDLGVRRRHLSRSRRTRSAAA